MLQITPMMVREAYSLLRQSIIHVEQDDVDFDEEDAPGILSVPNGHGTGEDESMDAADIAAAEAAESSYAAATTAAGTSSVPPPQVDGPSAPAASKRKMRITCESAGLIACAIS